MIIHALNTVIFWTISSILFCTPSVCLTLYFSTGIINIWHNFKCMLRWTLTLQICLKLLLHYHSSLECILDHYISFSFFSVKDQTLWHLPNQDQLLNVWIFQSDKLVTGLTYSWTRQHKRRAKRPIIHVSAGIRNALSQSSSGRRH
jgi:hypothetical protein